MMCALRVSHWPSICANWMRMSCSPTLTPALKVNGIDDVCGRFGIDAALNILASAYDPKAKKKSDSNPEHPLKTVIDEIPSVRTLAKEEIEFLVPGLIVKGTVTVISGEAASGKSHLAFWLSHKIASGGEILGESCQQHPVLYLTRENPWNTLRTFSSG